MRFQNAITIERSAAEVFEYLADFEKVPTWNYAIVETRKISEGPVGVGTKYRQVRKLPRPSEEGFEVTEFEPEARPRWRGPSARSPVASGTCWNRLTEARGSPTWSSLNRRGLRLAGGLATSKLKSAVGANPGKLKELLEGGS